MKTISISNRKGGVGKTTTSHNLASGLAMKGFKVLLIDFDEQRNLSRTVIPSNLANLKTIFNLLQGEDISQCIYKTKNSNLNIIIGDEKLLNADKIFIDIDSPYLLKKQLDRVKNYFDFCIIDTPPHLGIVNVNSMTASDEIIIPMEASTYSMEGLSGIIETFQKVKQFTNKDIKIGGVLITKYEGRTIFKKSIRKELDEISKKIGLPVYDTTIRKGVAIEKSQSEKKSIFEYDSKSNVATDYQDFINEYLSKNNIKGVKKNA